MFNYNFLNTIKHHVTLIFNANIKIQPFNNNNIKSYNIITLLEIYFGGDKCRNFDHFAHLMSKIISAEYLINIIYLRRNISPVR